MLSARRKSSIAASSSCSERITSEPRGGGGRRRPAAPADATAAVAPHNENLLAMGVGATPVGAGKPPGTPARRLVPAKLAGSQNVSATWWPQAQSSASRRVARKKEARFGNVPGAASSRVLSDQATAAPASSHRSRHLKAPARPLPPEGRNMAQPRQTAKPEIVVHQRSGRSSGFANLGQTLLELRRESDRTRCACEPTSPHHDNSSAGKPAKTAKKSLTPTRAPAKPTR